MNLPPEFERDAIVREPWSDEDEDIVETVQDELSIEPEPEAD